MRRCCRSPACCWRESLGVRTRGRKNSRISSLLLRGRRGGAERQQVFSFGSPSRASHPHSLALFEPFQRLEGARSRGRPASLLSSKKRIVFINIPSVFSPPPDLLWFPPFSPLFSSALEELGDPAATRFLSFHSLFLLLLLSSFYHLALVVYLKNRKKACTGARVMH